MWRIMEGFSHDINKLDIRIALTIHLVTDEEDDEKAKLFSQNRQVDGKLSQTRNRTMCNSSK